MAKGANQRFHPALVAVLAVLGTLLAVRLLPISISIETPPTQTLPPGEVAPQPPPTSVPVAPPLALATDPVPDPLSGEAIGGFRVSNQTRHPIRVALLAQAAGAEAPSYAQPAHWDFAPEEGREKGLVLSLPNQKLQLRSGDILVAFAQDGSQRYWGPYVVGKTASPGWSASRSEWQLVLRP
jgi:hypothetical protein